MFSFSCTNLSFFKFVSYSQTHSNGPRPMPDAYVDLWNTHYWTTSSRFFLQTKPNNDYPLPPKCIHLWWQKPSFCFHDLKVRNSVYPSKCLQNAKKPFSHFSQLFLLIPLRRRPLPCPLAQPNLPLQWAMTSRWFHEGSAVVVIFFWPPQEHLNR